MMAIIPDYRLEDATSRQTAFILSGLQAAKDPASNAAAVEHGL
jgi:hypothetical protein